MTDEMKEILSQWKKDSTIDPTSLKEETLRSGSLHHKYLSLLMESRSRQLKTYADLTSMRKAKERYYSGAMSKEELKAHGWEQYQGPRLLKAQLSNEVEADADIIALKTRDEYLNLLSYQLESILTQIKNRDWAIKAHIDYIKFQAGA